MSMRKSKKPKQTMLERKCRFEGKCEIHGCEKKKKKKHKRFLHTEIINVNVAEFLPTSEKVFNTCSTTFIAVRTIPVILKTHKKRAEDKRPVGRW